MIQPGGVGHRRARQHLRGAGPRRARRADGQDAADPRGLDADRRPDAPAHQALYTYCNAVMEPWDGPAAICATDGRWVGGRQGPQRPAPAARRLYRRRPADHRLGGRHGPASPRAGSSRKAHISPGRMIAVDLAEGRALRRGARSSTGWPTPTPTPSGWATSSSWSSEIGAGRRAAPVRPRGADPPSGRRRPDRWKTWR